MIKIIGNIEKAKKALGTNIDLYLGQKLKGNEEKMKILCQKYPELFVWESDDWSSNMKVSPSKNKMMDKYKFKSKKY